MKKNILENSLTNTDSAIIERLTEYFQSINIFDALVHLGSNTFYVKFPAGDVTLSREQILEVLKIVLGHTSLVVNNLGFCATYDLNSSTLVINKTLLEHIANVVTLVESWKLPVERVKLSNSNEFSVFYVAKGRGPIDYEGLEEIRNLVDPKRENRRSVIVFGDGTNYDMRVRTAF